MTGKKNTARANSQSESFIYYECSQYLNSNRKGCATHYVKGEDIAAILTKHLLELAEYVLGSEYKKNIIEPLKEELRLIRKQVLDTREELSKTANAFTQNFEDYAEG